MSSHTSFRIGGPADLLVTAHDVDELLAVLGCCRRENVPLLVLGRGTNLLVRDGGIRGAVLRLAGGFTELSFDGETVRAGAAVSVSSLAREAGRRGLTGLEFAIGIPGTVGGAIVMNAGAYGSEMRNVVEWVEAVVPGTPLDAMPTGDRPARDHPPDCAARDGGGQDRVIRAPSDRLDFGYRTSRPGREGWIVTAAGLRLATGDPARIAALEKDYTARRRARQPLDFPSAGSVFKRPEGHYAGPLIQDAGCKGLRVGGAEVSTLHANFIVNRGGATAADVLALIEEVRRRVRDRCGMWLETEIRVVGEGPEPEAASALRVEPGARRQESL